MEEMRSSRLAEELLRPGEVHRGQEAEQVKGREALPAWLLRKKIKVQLCQGLLAMPGAATVDYPLSNAIGWLVAYDTALGPG